MNKMFACALGTAALVASLGFSLAQAQDSKPPTPGPRQPAAERPQRPGGPGGQRVDRIQQLTEQLGLKPEQVEKLRPILAQETKNRRALREETTLTPAERREKVGKLNEATRKKIKDAKILTDEQAKKWDAIQEEQRKRAAEGRTRGNAPGGGPRRNRASGDEAGRGNTPR